MTANDARPPASAVWLIDHLLPEPLREPFLGDLEEAFRERLACGASVRACRLWYWHQALRAPVGLSRTAESRRTASSPRGDGPMTQLLGDLQFALRLLAQKPAFTALAAITLAIGIGATTAIFSAVNPILFESLPYPHPDRVVMVWERGERGDEDNVGFATYADIARINTSFDAIAAVKTWQPTMTGRSEPERLDGQGVSATFFRALGVRPALGRDFRASEDVKGGDRVAILSSELWRGRFGGDSTMIGKQITLDGVQYTVVGVMPAGFENVLEPAAKIWTPLRYDTSLPWACRTCHHLRAVARLKPGVSPTDAAREMDVVSRDLVRAYPSEYAHPGMLVVPLQEDVTRVVRPALLAVLGAVGFVLLIACANVMNLLLARGAQRQGEFSVRAALGASQRRLVRQLLTESLVLAAIGGALGVGVAELGVRALVAMSPAGLPRLGAIRVDGHVLAFALAITTLVGVVFGLVPALHAASGDLHHGIKLTSRRTAGTARMTRAALVISEVALALMLLVGAGLLLQSVSRLLGVAPGFDASHLLTMQVQAAGPRFANDTTTRAFFDRALDAVRQVPGVESASFTSQLPLSGDFDGYGVHIESKPRANPEEDPSAFRYAVRPGYLSTMGIPLIRGRGITERDRGDQPAVVLISAAFARRAWPGEDPIGQRVRVGGATSGPWRTIVGIVGDVRQVSLAAERPDAIYVPESQWQFADNAMSLVVRTHGDAAALAPAVRRAVWSVDKDQPIVRVATMDDLVAASASERRFALILFETFAIVALVLAAAGIYGVLSGTVAERLREIGIRAALGASRRDILTMVVRQGLVLTGVGVLVGIGAAVALTRVIAGLLFSVSRVDPLTYVGVTAVLVGVALVACWVPALRATRVDPVLALRAE